MSEPGHVQELSDWVVEGALADIEGETLFAGFCDRLATSVAPLWRAHLAMRTLHPLFDSVTLTWTRGGGVTRNLQPHDGAESAEWNASPFKAMIDAGERIMRHRLDRPGDWERFPLLRDLRDRGATDYLAMVTPFAATDAARRRNDGMAASWTTDRPGGFNDEHVAALERLQPRVALAAKLYNRQRTAQNVVAAYLGEDAGRRVLDGQIRLGDGQTIAAVIWYSDLRDSTPLADRLGGAAFLALLNDYFACLAGAVLDNGGQVLRFIGDAVLGIFPVGADAYDGPEACRRALAAAADAGERVAAVNAANERGDGEAIAFGLGLHMGEIHYGNIGTPRRIEFSVVGAAANEACRLEGLTKTLDRPVLVSDTVARHLDLDWIDLGQHPLKGVDGPVRVLAPPA